MAVRAPESCPDVHFSFEYFYLTVCEVSKWIVVLQLNFSIADIIGANSLDVPNSAALSSC